MKRYYDRLCLTPYSFDMEGPVLDGSFTNKAIKVNKVEVATFDNGFETESGDEIPFKEITFD